jgi:archaellum component FlaG (FlaF/FlaG flagellin family)
MGFYIEDGEGSGRVAGVDAERRLRTLATSEDFDAHINKESNKVWSIPFEGLNPDGADDYVVYIKNTGDKVLHVSDIRVMADTAATQLEVHAVSGTASGGTAITAVPKTIGAAATPSATIESGTDITGLTNDGILYFIQCAVVNTEYQLDISSRIRIPKGKALALLVETATANITGVITIVEEE